MTVNDASTLLLLLAVMVILHSSSAQRPVYPEVFVSTFIEPLYDDYGLEVTEDQLLEMADMRSTSLGFGAGLNYTFPHVPQAPVSTSPQPPSSPSRQTGKPSSSSRSFPAAAGFHGFSPYAFRRFKRQAGFDGTNSFGDKVFSSYGIDINNNDNNNNNHGASSFDVQIFSKHANTNNNDGPSSLGDNVFSRYADNSNNNNDDDDDDNNNNFESRSLGDQFFNNQANSISNNFDGTHFQEPPRSDLTLSTSPNGDSLYHNGDTFGQFPSHIFRGFSREGSGCAPQTQITCEPGSPYRTIDGSCNNVANPKWGAINQHMKRLLPADYFDGYDVPRLASTANPRHLLPCARLVSRIVLEPVATEGHHAPGLTNLVQVWGQFLAHDITGTPAHKVK
ncbi:uncharacterized protein LOC143277239 [Babylonia areolata]|uniref:uncharacterized protein LOC143277239 n=1 Tax=Babylonia areolata TaxID=304850 RepID=UPI003FCF34EC